MNSGYRTLPDELKAQIDAIGDAKFVFGAARPYSDDVEARWITALGLDLTEEAVWQGLPPATLGRWSRWNIVGREITRKDRPKVTRSWSVEAPNYRGDGTHTIYFTREVYRRERLYGRQIEASVIRVDEPIDRLVGTVQLELKGPYDSAAEQEYLYAASLARTWFGSVSVISLDDAGAPVITENAVDWEFLPPGTREQIRDELQHRLGGVRRQSEIDVMVDRLFRVQSLSPERRLIGTSGLQRYIGYMFGDDFVAFENPRVGNALYLIHGDWETLGRLSRSELLAFHGDGVDRIIHTANWFDKLRLAVYSYRHPKPD